MRGGRHRRGALAALLVGLVSLLTACGGGAEAGSESGAGGEGTVTVEHAQGSTSLEGTPQRIVVFDLGVLETLDDLGVEGIVGVPEVANLPERLSEYASDDYTKVGSLKEPDFEQVNALEPDLIIVAARSAPAYGELSEIAPTVDLSVDTTNFLASATERIETLGTLFGKEDVVRNRLDALSAKAEEVASSGAEDKTGLVVLTTGGKLSAYGPGSRFGIVYDDLGVKPAVDGLSADTHGDAISSEFIAEANPDLLFVIDRDSAIGEAGQSAKQVLDNALVGGTTAAKEDGIVYLDPTRWYLTSNGLPSLEAMVTAVGDSVA